MKPTPVPADDVAETWMASAPAATAARACSAARSTVVPPSTPYSWPSSLTRTAKSGPQRSRMAVTTSTSSRARFPVDPPYSSSRRFQAGDRNVESR